MTADEMTGAVPGVCLSTQCSGLLWLFAFSMKERARVCVREILCDGDKDGGVKQSAKAGH